MGKLKHYSENGSIFYITTVTNQRRKIFLNRDACYLLLANIAYHRYMMDFNLLGYVIMPDHLHLLVQPSNHNPLSKIMKWIKGNFARKYNHLHNTAGHVWQKEYYETVMRTERDVINRLNYLHHNPVRGKLVSKAEDYEYSSARQYIKTSRTSFQIPINPVF